MRAKLFLALLVFVGFLVAAENIPQGATTQGAQNMQGAQNAPSPNAQAQPPTRFAPTTPGTPPPRTQPPMNDRLTPPTLAHECADCRP
ncbi:hypothetical protein [Helicobacter heilmannii]|uniref:hypothetical protein n=1 Tax=Helicobacter heilmannii TaxID=35817 RepID=UPI000CF0A37C|nr:hypothetical protein [Helicobacter heilmannii]